MEAILAFLQTEAAANLILGAIALAVGYFLKRSAVKKYKLERCILALQTGVQETYEEYVKSIKEASTDGKLTESEKMQARDRAWNAAKVILQEEGIDLAKYYGPRISKAVIEALIKRSKTAGNMAKGILEPEADGA